MSSVWTPASLGEICTKVTDGSHNPPKGIEASSFMMLSSKNVLDDQITLSAPRFLSESDFLSENKRTEVQSGDVLLTIVGTVGRAAVVPPNFGSFTLQRSVAVLKPIPEIVDSRFLMFALQNSVTALQDQSQGVAQKGIYLKALKALRFSLPPLEEQKRIVAVLDQAFAALDRARALAEANLADAEELEEQFLDRQVEALYQKYGSISIGTIASVKGGKRLPKGQKTSAQKTPFPYISVRDMTEEGTIDVDSVQFMSESNHMAIRKYTISQKDVYVSIAGTIAKTGVVPDELDGANLTENAAKLVLKDGWSRNFVYWCTRSTNFREQAIEQTRTAAQPKLALQRLAAISIPAADTKSQDLLVKRVTEFGQSIGTIFTNSAAKLSDIEDLRQSLLQKAFAGELT